MLVPAAARDVFDLIEKSGLLTGRQVQKLQQQLAIDPSTPAEEAARRLVRERALTPFQAERLLEGRYRGLVIDGYRIRELLGFGGMGCVFIAEDPEQERKVAVKVLSAEHALDAGMLARMKLEAAAGMRLSHPNIIRTYRLDSTGAVHYLVMELVRGISLHELVALHGPLKWSMACDFGVQAAEALAAAHAQGIIHRDIKPANFLIDQNGVTRILDFGLALISGIDEEEFSLSMVFGHDCLGTPDYIAPEQSLDSRAIDARADVYSLGATLYVALTAHVPFPDKSNKAKLEAHRTRLPRNVCELRPEIPAEIGAIVARAMAKKPEDRFQNMAAFADALRPFAKRKNVQFDFRELVTLRAKQARARVDGKAKRSIAPKSSITSASGWLQASGHQFSDTSDSFARTETPSLRMADPEQIRPENRSASATSPIRPVASRSPAPAGWRLQIPGTKTRYPLNRSRHSIGSGAEADIRISEDSLDKVQCWVEYDGQQWQFRQASKSQATWVNGSAEAYAPLRHGSVISFGGKTRLRLISLQQQQKNRRRLVRAGGILATLAVVALLIWYGLRLAGVL